MVEHYDVVVLGGGVGGYSAAIHAAKNNLSVALVEKAELGGTCLHRGCIPTKALLRSAEVAREVELASAFGVDIKGEVSFNFTAAQKRKEVVVNQLYKGVQSLMKMNKIKVYQGNGSVLGPSIFAPLSGTVSVTRESDDEDLMLTSDKLIIATGSRPSSLPSLPVDEAMILSSDGMLALEALPKDIIIVGGGVIGVEWASLLNDFGVKVTIVEFLGQLLPNEDPTVSRQLARHLERQGITVHLNAEVLSSTQDETVQLKVRMNEGEQELSAEKVMVAVGRKPNVENIGLENTAVRLNQKGIEVNEYYQTHESQIYAIGDVIPSLQLAHVAMKEAQLAVDHISDHPGDVLDYTKIPRCVYSYPEVASVGLTKKEAETHTTVRSGRFDFTANGKALIHGDGEGFIQVISDTETDDVLGISMIGPSVTELISEASLALYLNASAAEIGQTVHPHPSLSEVLQEASLDVNQLSINK